MFHQDCCKQNDSKMVKTLNIHTCNWYSGRFLEANYKLIKQLNPDLKFRWLICNHNPPGYNDIVNHEEYVIFDKENYDNNIGSISHGKGMNYLFRQAINLKLDAYYHLTLDPDFYLFRPVKDLINKIIDLNIDILGAAYVFQGTFLEYIIIDGKKDFNAQWNYTTSDTVPDTYISNNYGETFSKDV